MWWGDVVGDIPGIRNNQCKDTKGEVCLDSVVRESVDRSGRHEFPQLRVLKGHYKD